MCGRMSFYYDKIEIDSEFEPDKYLADYDTNYNAAPSQLIPNISFGSTTFNMVRWGLIPSWSKDGKMAMSNARAESLESKPFFKNSFHKFRVLIPVSNFFEWSSSKQPYLFKAKGKEIFALAGLASFWKPKDAKDKDSIITCCVITTEATKEMRGIHHRMPLIIEKKDYQKWINPATDLEVVSKLLKPTKAKLDCWPVDKRMNTPKFNNSEVVEKVKVDKDGKL